MAKPKQKLEHLTIKEGSVVERGDNPEAHIMIVKNAEDDRSFIRKMWDWATNQSVDFSTEKYMTTAEILAEEKFISDFNKLRGAFREAVEMSMCLPVVEMSQNMKRSVDEFMSEALKMTTDLEKAAPEAAETLKGILDDLSAQSDTKDEQGREKFAKAVEALETFSMPKVPATQQPEAQEATTEKEATMAQQVEKSLEDILADLPEGEAATIRKSIEDADAKATAAVDTLKTITERLETLEKKQERTKFVDMAKEVIGEAALDLEKTADSLQAAFGVSTEAGDTLVGVLKAASAQASTDSLFVEAGSEAPDADTIGGGTAEERLKALAADIRKEDPSLSEFAAYNKAAEQNPELKAEAVLG